MAGIIGGVDLLVGRNGRGNDIEQIQVHLAKKGLGRGNMPVVHGGKGAAVDADPHFSVQHSSIFFLVSDSR